MNTLITLLKNRTVQWSLIVAVLSALQGFVFELPLTPIHQMIVGVTIAVVVVILKYQEGV
jgi:predicted permease